MDRAALERLKWRSRRGLLELDLVFERFWRGPGLELEEGEAAALGRLLALPDNDLLDLVMGPGGDAGCGAGQPGRETAGRLRETKWKRKARRH
jgi:succinate dehydrogenase flavin-adding protein (antitoxin of CptAB toxin-antitoxin module)